MVPPSATSAPSAVGKLNFILPHQERRDALRLLVSMVLVSLIESLGVGTILLAVVVPPRQIRDLRVERVEELAHELEVG